MRALWTSLPAVLIAAIVVLAPAAASDRKPPRIVAAAMIDADNDARADGVRVTYSERIRHAADRDGRYPFAVSGYRIRSVGKASGKALVILLVEQAQPDPAATPALRYRRTNAQPVRDRAGNQALAQLFVKTKAHGRTPPPPPPVDADGDGTPDADDCAPKDASIHPGATDTPDLVFVDSNCDGIDGTERDAVFASPTGNDANPGTKARPKREIRAAIATVVAGNGRYVLVAFGAYRGVKLASGVSIFGGYDPTSWARRDRFPDGLPLVSGPLEGVLAEGAKNVVLQHLKVRGTSAGDRSIYGIRAIAGSILTLQRVAVSAEDGPAGTGGLDNGGLGGLRGAPGEGGRPGKAGSCDGARGLGGFGGFGPGLPGGSGGHGGFESGVAGTPGTEGKIGTPGGAVGKNGNPGTAGAKGASGENGGSGSAGAGGTNTNASAVDIWVGQDGGGGGFGEPGNGGGGGGGGGSQQGSFVNNGGGNGGGGGGAGGIGGFGGRGGTAGFGSFGVYLFNSKVVVEASTIAAGKGGAGGAGGDGGFGGAGGRGGGGGGGAGGPSIGIFKVGTSTATVKSDSKVTSVTPAAGGAGGGSGPGGTGRAGAAGIAQPISP